MRLIDADALFDALRDNEFQTFCPLDEVDDVIAAAPTLDYAPVVHGNWKLFGISPQKLRVSEMMQCTECCVVFNRFTGTWYKFCPNCGAKMDGGGDA